MEASYIIGFVLGLFVGNTVFHKFLLKKTWKDSAIVGLLAALCCLILLLLYEKFKP